MTEIQKLLQARTSHSELDDLCLDEFDPAGGRPSTLLSTYRDWRDAVREHVTCVASQDADYHAGQARFPENIRHFGLPTFFSAGMARARWEHTAATLRTESGLPQHAYVAKTGGAYEAVCPEHPRFRRIAWTHRRTPLSSAREHNLEDHDGAPARVYSVPGREPSCLMP